MASYTVTWVTDILAVGYAPMSYDDLAAIRSEGITAIINLCGEFCDLHEIELSDGFKVHYLPIPDECAPDMAALEAALDWIDAMHSAGCKVLVHCRFGVGRTGTFVTAYLLRRGHDLKKAAKILDGTRANPTHYCQWKLLRQYRKKIEQNR
jgi:protein-tyrosine phosphatase